MATKGASNRYGTKQGKNSPNNPHGVNYEWARDFNKYSLDIHFDRHGKEFGLSSKESYKQHAIRYANTVDKKNCTVYVDIKGTTYKFNNKTGELAIISKKGIVISYYKVSEKFRFINKKGETKWIKKK